MTKLKELKTQFMIKNIRILAKKEKIVINHLRIGHIRLPHKFLTTKEEPAQYTICKFILTVKLK